MFQNKEGNMTIKVGEISVRRRTRENDYTYAQKYKIENPEILCYASMFLDRIKSVSLHIGLLKHYS